MATAVALTPRKDLVIHFQTLLSIIMLTTIFIDSKDDISEFIYPANWVGDQTVLYRTAKKRELERSLDPPSLNLRPRSNANEPLVAFGPPGSSGELNVSVIVSPVAQDFS